MTLHPDLARFSASLVQPRSRIQPQPLAGPPSPSPPAVPCPLAKVPRPIPNRTKVLQLNISLQGAFRAASPGAEAGLTISKDQQTWLDNNYAALVARDVQALERGRRQHGTRPGPSKPQRGRMDRFKRCRREIYIRKSRRSSLSCCHCT